MLTKTRETEERYISIADYLLRRCAADLLLSDVEIITAQQFAAYLINNKLDFSPATFRQYKASIHYYLKKHSSKYSKEDFNKALELLKTPQTGCPKITEKTSQLKKKNISIKDIKDILDILYTARSKYALATILWIRCGVLTGLRPNEWENAYIEKRDNKYLLKVKNAKNTNGRGFAEVRHLDISYLNQEELAEIKSFLHLISSYKKDSTKGFSLLQQGCQELLKQKNKKLNPHKKRVTLYSTRHAFASMAKKLYSREEVACLMGHKTNKTASIHYGKKTSMKRSGSLKVKPLENEVLLIKKIENTRTSLSKSNNNQYLTPKPS